MRFGFWAPSIISSKGGLERFASRLTAWLAERGHKCFIFHAGPPDSQPIYPCHHDVSLRGLSGTGQRFKNYEILKKLELDAFCSLHDNGSSLTALLACYDADLPMLVSERNSPGFIENISWNRLERLAVLQAASEIHLLSRRYADSIPTFLANKVNIIPNAAPDVSRVFSQEKREENGKMILCVARLEDKQKQLSLLIKAFYMLAANFPDWKLVICGEGPSRWMYEKLIKQLDLEERVELAGVKENIEEYYNRAAIFCLPSRWEGSPNALLEAQSYGLPSVGFARCVGVADIIIDGATGILVNEMSSSALARGLEKLMRDKELRKQFSDGAKAAISRFLSHDIYDKWERLLVRTSSHKGMRNMEEISWDEQSMIMATLKYLLYKNVNAPNKYDSSAISRLRKSHFA